MKQSMLKKGVKKFVVASISNKEQLKNFLITENNSYSHFILNKMTKKIKYLSSTITHRHHIIPLHSKGLDSEWNCIQLLIEDHIYAHKLLYINYGNFYDLAASNMLQGNKEKGIHFIQKQNHLQMREKKIGFYSSITQRELAKRTRKKRKPFSKNFFVHVALKKGFLLKHIQTNQTLVIKPDANANITEVIDQLMNHPQMKHKKVAWDHYQKKEKSYGVSALTRILTGHIDKKTGKSVYSFMGWQLLGIFVEKNVLLQNEKKNV